MVAGFIQDSFFSSRRIVYVCNATNSLSDEVPPNHHSLFSSLC